jgi:hypothetical protein
MKKHLLHSIFTRFLTIAVFLGVCSAGAAADHFLDVVDLHDGTRLTGIIIDQNTGESIKLETPEGEVITFLEQEVARIEKVQTSQYSFDISFIDVVCLTDGVIFRGLITEQIPGHSLTLRLSDEVDLTIPSEQVFKVLKQKRVEAVRPQITEAQDRVLRIALQIEINLGALRGKAMTSAAAGGVSTAPLKNELQDLKEEIRELEQGLDEAELETAVETLKAEGQEIDILRQELEELIDELLEALEACENESGESTALWPVPELVAPLPARLQLAAFSHFSQNYDEQAQAHQVADQNFRGKSLEELEGSFSEILEELSGLAVPEIVDEEELNRQAEIIDARTGLALMLQTQRWKKLWNMPVMTELVEVLPQKDRELLYLTHKNQNLWLGIGLNAIPGLYLGSWAQGDTWGALIGYVHSIAAFAAADMIFLNFSVDTAYIDAEGYYHKYAKPQGLGWLSFGVLGASYAIGLLQPVLFVRRWNRRLAERLDVDPKRIEQQRSEIAVAPPGVEMRCLESGDLGVELELVSLSY